MERHVKKLGKLIVQRQSVKVEVSTEPEILRAARLENCANGSCLSSTGSNGSFRTASTASISRGTAPFSISLLVTTAITILTFLCRKISLSAVATKKVAQLQYKHESSQERQKINHWSVLPQKTVGDFGLG